MRTVTFSDLPTARRIHASAVPAWVNVSPAFHNCDPGGESSIWSAEPEVFATKNIATFFATPDFRVVDYLSGFWHPKFFEKELDFVERVRPEVFDEKGTVRGDAAARLRRAHRARAAELGKLVDYYSSEARWEAGLGPDAIHDGHRHADSCRWSLVNGLGHLRDVHTAFGKSSGGLDTFPRLSLLLESYRYGNEFAEGMPLPIPRELRAAMRGR